MPKKSGFRACTATWAGVTHAMKVDWPISPLRNCPELDSSSSRNIVPKVAGTLRVPFADALKRLLFAALRHTECAYYFQLLKDELPIRERTSKLLRDNSFGFCRPNKHTRPHKLTTLWQFRRQERLRRRILCG